MKLGQLNHLIAVAEFGGLRLPQQWIGFTRRSRLLSHIKVAEELVAPTICVVRRSRLPLTPVAQHLCDLFHRSALNQQAWF